MKWFKVDVNELLFPDCKPAELLERFRLRAFCAQYECLPPEHVTKNSFNLNPKHELEFIQCDINATMSHRKSAQVAYKKQSVQQSVQQSDGADKIRLDKIINKPVASVINPLYLKLFNSYPADKRIGKDECYKLFNNLTAKQKDDIFIALDNYKTCDAYKKNLVLNFKNWFKDWEVWLDYKKPVKINPMELLS